MLLPRYAPTDALNLSVPFYIPAVIGAAIRLPLLKGGIYRTFYALIAIAVACAFGLLAISVGRLLRASISATLLFLGVVHACEICPYSSKFAVPQQTQRGFSTKKIAAVARSLRL